MRYWPAPSVTTVRPRSMSTALVAVTVTPGTGVPDPSWTVPAIAPWASAVAGTPVTRQRKAASFSTIDIESAQEVILHRLSGRPFGGRLLRYTPGGGINGGEHVGSDCCRDPRGRRLESRRRGGFVAAGSLADRRHPWVLRRRDDHVCGAIGRGRRGDRSGLGRASRKL